MMRPRRHQRERESSQEAMSTRVRSSPPWFREIFGFEETSVWAENVAHFRMNGEVLECKTSAHPPQHVGRFTLPSVDELHKSLVSPAGGGASSDCDKRTSNGVIYSPTW